MKNSKTTLKELTARYRAVLLKCLLINAGVLISMGASAATLTDGISNSGDFDAWTYDYTAIDIQDKEDATISNSLILGSTEDDDFVFNNSNVTITNSDLETDLGDATISGKGTFTFICNDPEGCAPDSEDDPVPGRYFLANNVTIGKELASNESSKDKQTKVVLGEKGETTNSWANIGANKNLLINDADVTLYGNSVLAYEGDLGEDGKGSVYIKNSHINLYNTSSLNIGELDNKADATLTISGSKITLNDDTALTFKGENFAETTIENNSQVFMNDQSEMNLNDLTITDSQIHMKDTAVLTMNSVVLQKAAIKGEGTNKVIIAGEDVTTFEDTSLEVSDADAIQVNKNGHFKIQAKNEAVSITGKSEDTSLILMDDKDGNTTVEIDGGTKGVTVNGAIISENKDNKLNVTGNTVINGLLDPLTTNISNGTTTHTYYADDILFNLNGNGVLKYTNDKHLYDSTKHGSTYALNSINFNGGSLDLRNGAASEIKLAALSVTAASSLAVDVDLANEKMDTLTAESIDVQSKLNITDLNLISDAKGETTVVDFTDDDKLLAQVDYTGATSGLKALSPVYSYDVAYDNTTGEFTFTRSGDGTSTEDYNPAVFGASVSGQTVALMQSNITSVAFDNLRTSSVEPQGRSSGDTPSNAHVWAMATGVDDNVDFKSFNTVDSEMVALTAGFNTDTYQFGETNATFGTYFGYLNGEQKYADNEITQDGGYIGFSAALRQGAAEVKATFNGGFMNNEAKQSFGTDKYDAYWTGVALKAGYDYKPTNSITITPNLYAGYTFVHTQDYTSKSGARIENGNLNLWEIAPGIKANKSFDNGWNTFAQAKYAFITDNGGKVTANDVALPNISVKDYVEYGIGAEKDLSDSWGLSATVNRRDGGRQGWNGSVKVNYYF